MKKLLFSFFLVTGFAIAANAQSNTNATTNSNRQVVSESAAPAQPAVNAEEAGVQPTNCGSKNASEASGTKKSCCAHGKKTAANCSEAKSDVRKEEKISE